MPTRALLLFLAIVLAGCSAGGSDATTGSARGFDEDAGAILGLVTDDSLLPLEGVNVTILAEEVMTRDRRDGPIPS